MNPWTLISSSYLLFIFITLSGLSFTWAASNDERSSRKGNKLAARRLTTATIPTTTTTTTPDPIDEYEDSGDEDEEYDDNSLTENLDNLTTTTVRLVVTTTTTLKPTTSKPNPGASSASSSSNWRDARIDNADDKIVIKAKNATFSTLEKDEKMGLKSGLLKSGAGVTAATVGVLLTSSATSTFPSTTTMLVVKSKSMSTLRPTTNFGVDAALPDDEEGEDDSGSSTVTEGSGLASFTLTGQGSSNRRIPNEIEGSGYAPTTMDPRGPPDTEPDGDEDGDVGLEEGSGERMGFTATPMDTRARITYPGENWNDKKVTTAAYDELSTTTAAAATASTHHHVVPTVPGLDTNKIVEDNSDRDRDDEDDPDLIFATDEPAIVERPTHTSQNLLAQPAMLAAVIGGAVIGLLCAILLVMYLVYRMRKKDEGSYALDEPTKRPGGYMRAPTNSGKEYYA